MRKKKVPMVGLTVVIPVEQRRELRLVAQEMNTNMADISRTANDMFLKHYKAMKKLGR